MNIITGSWMSHAVCVTIQLGIPDLLAKGPCTAEELSSTTASLGRRHRLHHWGGRSSLGAPRRRVAVLHCAEVAPPGHRVGPCYDCDFYDLRQLASPVRSASCGNRPVRPISRNVLTRSHLHHQTRRRICKLLILLALMRGSSGWTRTSNPLNRLMQVGYLVGSSCV